MEEPLQISILFQAPWLNFSVMLYRTFYSSSIPDTFFPFPDAVRANQKFAQYCATPFSAQSPALRDVFTLMDVDRATYLFQIFSHGGEDEHKRPHGGPGKPWGRRTSASVLTLF